MKYLPYENITYRTKLDVEEVFKRLNEIIEPVQGVRMPVIFGGGDHKPYEGSIKGMSFKISRVIGYRNSFLPVIKGVVEKDNRGVKVHVKMGLTIMDWVSTLIVYVGLMFIANFMFIFNVMNSQVLILIFVGVPIFIYGTTQFVFKSESIESKKYFAKLLDAEIEESS